MENQQKYEPHPKLNRRSKIDEPKMARRSGREKDPVKGFRIVCAAKILHLVGSINFHRRRLPCSLKVLSVMKNFVNRAKLKLSKI